MAPKVKPAPSPSCPHHLFANDSSTIKPLRASLLSWYDDNKRTLPWRTIADEEEDDETRGYAVWVSEVMLQQTQVATVIEYYKRWMKKWPTAEALFTATLEEVHEVWVGLGYYSRGKRLWEGAKKVTGELDGIMPRKAVALEKELPGVGKYTASAIASIAFKQPVGVVDGNVIRVFSRMRVIGAESTSQPVTEALWKNANDSVDPARPGDFNQALMELGATICTPKNPQCNICPVADHCLGFERVKTTKKENKSKIANVKEEPIDIEDLVKDCSLCLPASEKYDSSVGVMNFPRKGKKTLVKEATALVCILHTKEGDNDLYGLLQRPETGLLASLYEFPNATLEAEQVSSVTKKSVVKMVNESYKASVDVKRVRHHGEYTHKFSHLKQTYVVWSAEVDSEEDLAALAVNPERHQQVVVKTAEEILNVTPVSTAMKKVFGVFQKVVSGGGVKRKGEVDRDCKRQKSITSFFGKK